MKAVALLKNVKIKQKLIGAFVFVILVFGVAMMIYQSAIKKTISGYGLAINAPIKAAFHLDEAKMNVLQASLHRERFVTSQDRTFLTKARQGHRQSHGRDEDRQSDRKNGGARRSDGFL